MSSLVEEFRKFAMRGNVLDLAVGVVIGAAFTAIVNSLVKDVIMPPVGLLLGNVDFSNLFLILKHGTAPGPYPTIDVAQKAGAVTLNYGVFVNNIITFVIVAFAVFVLVRAVNRLRRPPEKKEEAPPPAPPEEVVLLREIRDSLQRRV